MFEPVAAHHWNLQPHWRDRPDKEMRKRSDDRKILAARLYATGMFTLRDIANMCGCNSGERGRQLVYGGRRLLKEEEMRLRQGSFAWRPDVAEVTWTPEMQAVSDDAARRIAEIKVLVPAQ